MDGEKPVLNGWQDDANHKADPKSDVSDYNPSDTEDSPEHVNKWPQDEQPVEEVTYKSLFMRNWHPTAIYCGVFWSFGMCVAFLGPTLLDLGCQTSSDMKQISWVFFTQLCCTLIGSMLAGYLAGRSSANFVLLVTTALIPICMFVIPFCEMLAVLAFVLAVMGINMGIVDCLANLQMIRLYGAFVGPFLQAMHFCYGLGAFVSPMIAEPFLLNEDCSPFIDNDTSLSAAELAMSGVDGTSDNQTLPAATLQEAQEQTRVRYAFWIMCILQVPIPVLVASLLYREKANGWKPEVAQVLANGQEQEVTASDNGADKGGGGEYGSIQKAQGKPGPFWQQEQYRYYRRLRFCSSSTSQTITITLCAGILMFIFDGLQSAYGGYIYSYALKSVIDFSKSKGAYLNALFWGMFALGRLLAIPLAMFLTATAMLAFNIVGCLVSMSMMLGLRHDSTSLIVGTTVFGLFLSSATPTTLAMAEGYIDITSAVTTFVVIMAALGDMVSPVIVGHLFVDIGPWTFLEFGLAMSIFSVFFYIFMIIIGTQTPKHSETTADSTSVVFCRVCCLRKPVGVRKEDKDVGETRHVKFYSRMSETSDSNYEMGSLK